MTGLPAQPGPLWEMNSTSFPPWEGRATGAEAMGPSPASPPPLLGRMPLAQMAEETSGILLLLAL